MGDGILRQTTLNAKHFGATSETDVAHFYRRIDFNWIIGGTDAHAKNYSILIGGSAVRLAPLYDIASILAYADVDPQKAKLAMKIGDEYRLRYIGLSDWRKLATNIRVDGDQLIDRLRAMALELPDRLSDEIKIMQQAGLNHQIITKLGKILPERAAHVAGL